MKSQALTASIDQLITRRDGYIAPLTPDHQQALAAASIVRQTVQQYLEEAATDGGTLASLSGLAHAFLDDLHLVPSLPAPREDGAVLQGVTKAACPTEHPGQDAGQTGMTPLGAAAPPVDRSRDEVLLAELEAEPDRTGAAVVAFLAEAQDHPSWHLRKNAVMATFVILRQTGLWHGLEPVRGMRTPTDIARTEEDMLPRGGKLHQKVRTRAATSDEVVLARLAARLDCGSDSLHRRAAALAIATAGAVVAEGPQVCWMDASPAAGDTAAALALAGRHLHNTESGWYVAPRTITLDSWGSRAIHDWRAEVEGFGRPPHPNQSIVYEGRKALTSDSAKISYDHHVHLSLVAADLSWLPGLTTQALGEWASAHTLVHHPDGLDAAAHVMGVDPLNCLRRLTKASQRGYRATT